jgi:hypothetical protein
MPKKLEERVALSRARKLLGITVPKGRPKMTELEKELLATVPDRKGKITSQELDRLSPEQQQIQLDYEGARELGLDFYIPGESADHRHERIIVALLEKDGCETERDGEAFWTQKLAAITPSALPPAAPAEPEPAAVAGPLLIAGETPQEHARTGGVQVMSPSREQQRKSEIEIERERQALIRYNASLSEDN